MMRQFALQKLRERTSNININKNWNQTNNGFPSGTGTGRQSTTTMRLKHSSSVAVQLDYYMSSQFAGIACGLMNNLYDGMDVSFLPTCPVGLEQQRVRACHNENPNHVVAIGSVEQNIFIPTLHATPTLKIKAVAAMFRRSPLCIIEGSLSSLSSSLSDDRPIGAHEDTVTLLQRMFPNRNVIATPRHSKIANLHSGSLSAIQAYMTTEVPTVLRHNRNTTTITHDDDDDDPMMVVTPLEGWNGAKLGYSQVLFTTEEALSDDRRQVVSAFLEATFRGWEIAIRDTVEAAKMVEETKRMLRLDDEHNDHWHPSAAYHVETLQLCNDFVKETFEGDRYGVINPTRWTDASRWLLNNNNNPSSTLEQNNYGLDSLLWQPPSQLLAGSELARSLLEQVKVSAMAFKTKYHRNPTLAVVTVGELKRYAHAERRLQLYSNASNSWFSKTKTGEANGISVTEINLGASTTTEDLLSQIYSLKEMDGIQLMWPLPDHIDSVRVYNAIELSKDVDGIHFVGQHELGNKNAFAPVTPAATIALMKKHGIDVKGKRVLVIGRSPIVGSPIAQMLREQNAIVTIAHSEVCADVLECLVRDADVVVTCAGCPGLVNAEWVSGKVVINVGSTFSTASDSLHSDIQGDIARYAHQYSPVPGGVGPLSAAMLFQNVARAAWDRMAHEGPDEHRWEKRPACLSKSFRFKDYTSALTFADKVNEMSTIMDHHANMSFSHKCVDGVDLNLDFFTFEANRITEKDYDAAKAVDAISEGGAVQMSDYTYELHDRSIATHPASPRGSSKLLRVNSQGEVSYYSNFSEAFPTLAKGCHIVFNDSRVLDARVFVKTTNNTSSSSSHANDEKLEMMILDMGNVNIKAPCNETNLTVMLRTDQVKEGDVFENVVDGVGKVKVVKINGIWEEDVDSKGNGTECVVQILDDTMSLEEYLDATGTVPIPPYFHRDAEASDKEAYNNVYAAGGGSVAAPTAGLHFTHAVLKEIGATTTATEEQEDYGRSCSFLSLHVGAGTFKPVLVLDARDHSMHAETFSVSVAEIHRIIGAIEKSKPIMAVGTTSSRTLESLYWCGVKRMRGLDDSDTSCLVLGQFEWVPLMVGEGKNTSRQRALKALVEGLANTEFVCGKTSLMIVPGTYDFKMVDHLVTNFHAPDSTLMLLVSAFLNKTGDEVASMYEEAQQNGFKFLSYGDVCVMSRQSGFSSK